MRASFSVRSLRFCGAALLLLPFLANCGGGGGSPVPPPPPAVGPVADVLAALRQASTQSQMQAAILKVTYKAALGYTVASGLYPDLGLTGDDVSSLATYQIADVDPTRWPTIRELFDQFQANSAHKLAVTTATIVADLQIDINTAYTSIEVPNNALLVMLSAQGEVPPSPPTVAITTRLNPVQSMLLYGWLVARYSQTATRTPYQDCMNACMRSYLWRVASITLGFEFRAALALGAAGITVASLPVNWPAWAAALGAAGASQALVDYISSIWTDYQRQLTDALSRYEKCISTCPTGAGGRSARLPGTDGAPCCRRAP